MFITSKQNSFFFLFFLYKKNPIGILFTIKYVCAICAVTKILCFCCINKTNKNQNQSSYLKYCELHFVTHGHVQPSLITNGIFLLTKSLKNSMADGTSNISGIDLGRNRSVNIKVITCEKPVQF